VIFIEGGAHPRMSAKVQPLLALDSPVVDPASADCAIFLFDHDPQEGLRGISFGNPSSAGREDLGREFSAPEDLRYALADSGIRKWLAGGTDCGKAIPARGARCPARQLDVQDGSRTRSAQRKS